MRLYVNLTDSPAQIQRRILDCCVLEINTAVLKAGAKIQFRIREVVVKALQSSPTYNSLARGVLQADFGLQTPQAILDGLINLWKQELDVKFDRFRPRGANIVGSFTINAIDSTFKNVLSSPYASYPSNGNVITWLNWLLLDGTSSVVRGYDVHYTAKALSRSGYAIMTRQNTNFSVNSAYSGTRRDNFVTEAMDKSEDEIKDIIQDEIQKAL